MYAVKDKQGNAISNFDEIVKAAEEFYTELYSTHSSHAILVGSSDRQDREVPCVTSNEVRKALQAVQKAERAESTADLIKDDGNII